MNRDEFIGGVVIWAMTVLFCQVAFGADAPATVLLTPHTEIKSVTKRYKLVPVTLEDGTPSMAIKPRNRVAVAAEKSVDWVRLQGKKHRKIVWTGKTAVDVGLKLCQVGAYFKH